MTTVFICYRRADSAPYAGRLHDRLRERFGDTEVFMDITAIEPGENFEDVVREVIGRCDIVLVLIGTRWLDALDSAQHRRLDDPDDLVRVEILTALERNIRVIPVLVGGARMPTKSDLPPELSRLAKLNAAEISDTRFHPDTASLIAAMERARNQLSTIIKAPKTDRHVPGAGGHPAGPPQLGGSIETVLEPDKGAYWLRIKPRSRSSLDPALLLELRALIDELRHTEGRVTKNTTTCTINYVVLASNVPGVFNLGYDLKLLRAAISDQDREFLEQYMESCVGLLFPWSQSFGLPITTISLVEGTALGGGFEAALASSIVIAEESSRMGFPEVLFNLFPGMGAYSFLTRRVGRATAEEMITSASIYSARQLHDMGVVDVIAEDGGGKEAVAAFIRRHARTGKGRRGFESMRREFDAITKEELLRAGRVWVDTAMHASQRDLQMMDRLIVSQERGDPPG